MARKAVMFGVFAALWCAAVAVSTAQEPAAADKKVWDGVFTSAQAARGKAPFERSCARCHNVELSGQTDVL